MRSRRTIETGTVQYGLKLISMILELMSGDGRSGLPATAGWRDTATPPSIASSRAAGVGRKRRQPHRGRPVHRFQRLLARDAVDGQPMPRLEAADSGLDVGI